MTKTPEEYFQEGAFAAKPGQHRGSAFSEAELSFMRKYMGLDATDVLKKIGIVTVDEYAGKAAPEEEVGPIKVGVVPEETAFAAESAPAVSDAAEEQASATESEAVASVAAPVLVPDGASAPAEIEEISVPEPAAVSSVAKGQALVAESEAAAAAAAAVAAAATAAAAAVAAAATAAAAAAAVAAEPVLAQEAASDQDEAEKVPASGPALAVSDVTEEQVPATEFEVVAVPVLVQEGVPGQAEIEEISAPEPAQPAADAATVVATAVVVETSHPEEPDLSKMRVLNVQENDAHSEMLEERPLEEVMRKTPELLMVGFFLSSQEFTVPTIAVQEVIRYEPPTRLPKAPEFVAGVINLRGKVTPLVHLRDMLDIRSAREVEDKFIIVCRRHGLQVGLLIERVHTMYRVPQKDVDWSVEAHLGISAEHISGLLKLGDKLVGIVSIDSIVKHVLG